MRGVPVGVGVDVCVVCGVGMGWGGGAGMQCCMAHEALRCKLHIGVHVTVPELRTTHWMHSANQSRGLVSEPVGDLLLLQPWLCVEYSKLPTAEGHINKLLPDLLRRALNLRQLLQRPRAPATQAGAAGVILTSM